jgi:hypothetical protein
VTWLAGEDGWLRIVDPREKGVQLINDLGENVQN